MFTITSSSLSQFIQKQLDLYFTDSHKVELEKKILEMTTTIDSLIPEIIKILPSQEDKTDKWQQNPSVLEISLNQLEELMKKSVDKKTNEIDRIILQLKAMLSARDSLFLNKTIGRIDWNSNKDYLNNKSGLLKNKEVCDRMLTCEEIISFLNLMPLNQCTSELGYYKEFARGIDERGKSFTTIFYLLKTGERSCFHKLDANETWTWFGKSPLSLFIIENGQLIEHVLNKSNEQITIPSQTWFSATVNEDKRHDLVGDDVPFTLVTCHCIPAFTLNSYHDNIIADEEASIALINACKKVSTEMQTNIIELLTPQYQEEFRQRVCQ